MKEFEGKVAFITGGASGIGLGMARAFAARGLRIMLADIDTDTLEKSVAQLAGDGVGSANLGSVACDVSDPLSIQGARETVLEKFGAVHVLCNNAGVSLVGPTAELPQADWDWVLGVNLLGVLHGVQAFVPLMKMQGESGHVINTASIAGLAPLGGKQAPYKVTKFGVVALSEVLRDELAKTKIGVSVLCPGPVRTDILSCEAHRPERFGPAPVKSEPSRAEQFAASVVNAGLDPNVVGQLVVSAVEADRLYIFTAPELRPMIEARHQMIAKDLDWAADHPLLQEEKA
jgi:NAD(P)-dependent dehydrogenase (short-subunit alcohol dehydrogenase family)